MKGFFSENSQFSSNRLIFIIGALWLMGVTTFLVSKIKQLTLTELMLFFTGIFSALAATKLIQKSIEPKDKKE